MQPLPRFAIVIAAVALFAGLAGNASAATIYHVLVNDSGNDRVLEFDTDGNFIGVFASGFSPGGVKQGPDGNVYISNFDQIATIGGGPIFRYSVNGTPLANAFNGQADIRPDDLAFDGNGDLFFGNPFGGGTEDDQVYRVDGPSSVTAVVPTSFNDPSNLTGTDTLNTPRGLTFDGDGDLIVADRNNGRLLEFDPATGNLKSVIVTGLNDIQTPHYDDGSIFFTFGNQGDVRKLREIDGSGNTVNNFDFGELELRFDPFVLPDGDVLISHFQGNQILRFESDLSSFTVFADSTTLFAGQTLSSPTFGAVIAIPEPASVALVGLGSIMLLSRRRGYSPV